jgi:hypothetical protein
MMQAMTLFAACPSVNVKLARCQDASWVGKLAKMKRAMIEVARKIDNTEFLLQPKGFDLRIKYRDWDDKPYECIDISKGTRLAVCNDSNDQKFSWLPGGLIASKSSGYKKCIHPDGLFVNCYPIDLYRRWETTLDGKICTYQDDRCLNVNKVNLSYREWNSRSFAPRSWNVHPLGGGVDNKSSSSRIILDPNDLETPNCKAVAKSTTVEKASNIADVIGSLEDALEDYHNGALNARPLPSNDDRRHRRLLAFGLIMTVATMAVGIADTVIAAKQEAAEKELESDIFEEMLAINSKLDQLKGQIAQGVSYVLGQVTLNAAKIDLDAVLRRADVLQAEFRELVSTVDGDMTAYEKRFLETCQDPTNSPLSTFLYIYFQTCSNCDAFGVGGRSSAFSLDRFVAEATTDEMNDIVGFCLGYGTTVLSTLMRLLIMYGFCPPLTRKLARCEDSVWSLRLRQMAAALAEVANNLVQVDNELSWQKCRYRANGMDRSMCLKLVNVNSFQKSPTWVPCTDPETASFNFGGVAFTDDRLDMLKGLIGSSLYVVKASTHMEEFRPLETFKLSSFKSPEAEARLNKDGNIYLAQRPDLCFGMGLKENSDVDYGGTAVLRRCDSMGKIEIPASTKTIRLKSDPSRCLGGVIVDKHQTIKNLQWEKTTFEQCNGSPRQAFYPVDKTPNGYLKPYYPGYIAISKNFGIQPMDEDGPNADSWILNADGKTLSLKDEPGLCLGLGPDRRKADMVDCKNDALVAEWFED